MVDPIREFPCEYMVFESISELTSAIASGHSGALAHLYRSRFDELYAEARRATGRDEAFCLDVVQDAMIRVIRSMKPMDTEKRLRGWLRVVVQSCAYDQLRRDARRAHREQVAVGAVRSARDGDELGERLAWLREEIAKQDGPDARLLVMRYRMGWTLQRIANAVGLRPGAVDGRIRRSTAALSRRAQETFDE